MRIMSRNHNSIDNVLKDILLKYYGIHSFVSKPLDGYEDLNAHVTSTDGSSESSVKEYVFKAFKRIDKTCSSILDIQTEMMQYLHEHGIKTTKPVPTIEGALWSSCNIHPTDSGSTEHLYFLLLEFVPGTTLRKVGNPLSLMQEVGRFAGKVDTALKSFCPVCKPDLHSDPDTSWGIPSMEYLKSRLPEYCDDSVVTMGIDTCQQFMENVIPLMSSFQKGYIHGDFNDCNIIVEPNDQHEITDYQISGLIDFGDLTISYYVYELAVLMADLMSASLGHAAPIEILTLLLKGYRQEFDLSESELGSLRMCICVRLLHYYILTGDSLQEDPSNMYLQSCLDREENIKVFKYLYSMEEQEFRTGVGIDD